MSLTRQTSRLFRRPNSPISFNSVSRRSFSYGRFGVTYVFRQTVDLLDGIVQTVSDLFVLFCKFDLRL